MRNLRRKLFVDSKVQGALALRVLLHWFVFCCVLSLALPLWQMMVSGELLRAPSNAMIEIWLQNAPVFLLLLALLPPFAWDTVKLSNRFAGPMYRLRKHMRRAASGETVEPVRFRDGDFWTGLAADYNTLLERLNTDRAQDNAATEESESVVSGG